MYRLREFLRRALYGRNGMDALNYFIFGLYVVLMIINYIFRLRVIYLIIWLLFFLLLFRMFSKNFARRRHENEVFNKIFGRVISAFQNRRNRVKDYAHVYKKCPHCKAVIRLPRRKGKHRVDCPKCKKEFKVHIFKDYITYH